MSTSPFATSPSRGRNSPEGREMLEIATEAARKYVHMRNSLDDLKTPIIQGAQRNYETASPSLGHSVLYNEPQLDTYQNPAPRIGPPSDVPRYGTYQPPPVPSVRLSPSLDTEHEYGYPLLKDSTRQSPLRKWRETAIDGSRRGTSPDGSRRGTSPDGPRQGRVQKKTAPLDDDTFLIHLYDFYYQRGFTCILIEKISNLLIYLILVSLLVVLTSFVNYTTIPTITRITPISVLFSFSWSRVPIATWIVAGGMLAFWCLIAIQFAFDLPELWKIAMFYRYILNIDDVTHTDWNTIMTKLSELTGLDNAQISARIMRKENYLISIFNKNVLEINAYSKPIEWVVTYSIINYLFDGEIPRKQVLDRTYRTYYVERLKKRLVIHGILFLTISPAIFIYLLAHYCFSYFDRVRNSSILTTRMWTPYAQYKFREYNELNHYFNARLAKARLAADEYLAQFPNHLLSIAAQFISFTAGALLGLILLMSAVSDNILINVTVWGRSLFVIAGGLSIVLAATRGMISDEVKLPECQKSLDDIAEHTHYRKRTWDNALGKEVHEEISALYQYRIVLFVHNMAAVLIAPLLLIFHFPNKAEQIIDFMAEFTVRDRIGYVCSLACFNRLHEHGNPKYGANTQGRVPKSQMTRNGKLEKSIVTFAQRHQWEMPNDCKQLIDNVNDYLESVIEEPAVSRRSLIRSMHKYHQRESHLEDSL